MFSDAFPISDSRGDVGRLPSSGALHPRRRRATKASNENVNGARVRFTPGPQIDARIAAHAVARALFQGRHRSPITTTLP